MDRPTTFSLIIPAYNEEEYIGRCLDAVMGNAHHLFSEVIVIDNGSTDRTAEIAGKYPGVRVIAESRKGPTRARQRGFLDSTSDVLVYVDADTLPPVGWADQIHTYFKEDTSVACVSGPYIFYDIPWFPRMLTKVWNWLTKLVWYLLGYLVIGGNFAIRRSVLEAMGGFDQTIEFYGDDVDIGRRAHRHGRVVYSLGLTMPSSARRLKAQGLLRTGNLYAKNMIAVVTSGRPTTEEYEDFR